MSDLDEDPLVVRMIAALDGGVAALPAVLPPGVEVVAAAGVWGDFGSVVVLRRDDDEDQGLLDDVYLLARSPEGHWLPPDSSSGSGMPEWVLDRAHGPRPGDLTNLGAQIAHVAGQWVVELTVMASRAVSRVEVRYGDETITVAVPAGGLVTLPGVVRSVSAVAEFRGFDEAGRLVAVERYQPLTESDRDAGFPDPSLWAGRVTFAG
ncbi:hypothetical protein [Actinoplanes sp. HUAS TT8]|uniref:hypothetical protein n=1 Tax=Actinoplanes sp. HUAS TT8 TaxID=3447453 RepID=UPI003F51D5D9